MEEADESASREKNPGKATRVQHERCKEDLTWPSITRRAGICHFAGYRTITSQETEKRSGATIKGKSAAKSGQIHANVTFDSQIDPPKVSLRPLLAWDPSPKIWQDGAFWWRSLRGPQEGRNPGAQGRTARPCRGQGPYQNPPHYRLGSGAPPARGGSLIEKTPRCEALATDAPFILHTAPKHSPFVRLRLVSAERFALFCEQLGVFWQNPKQQRATMEKVVGYMTLGIGTAALPTICHLGCCVVSSLQHKRNNGGATIFCFRRRFLRSPGSISPLQRPLPEHAALSLWQTCRRSSAR